MTQIIPNENVVVFDVDDTLICWSKTYDKPAKGKIAIKDPYMQVETIYYLKPHSVHVRLLKQYKERGNTIIIWSMAGYKWAHEVAKELGLLNIADIIMTKPNRHVDDKSDVESIVGVRVFLKDKDD